MTIYKTVTFDSAHRLEGHPKCGKLHGHTYKAEVWLTTHLNQNEETILDKQYNFVFDFHYVKDYFDKFDHSDVVIEHSCEVMVLHAVKHFYRSLEKMYPNIEVGVKVRIWETPTSYAEMEL